MAGGKAASLGAMGVVLCSLCCSGGETPPTEIDALSPCAVDNGGCGAGVACENARGMPSCGGCAPGQAGMPPNCLDIDECAERNGGCDVLTSCTNANVTGQAPVCGPCPPGYAGTGEMGCADVDECAIDNGGCGPLSTCSDVDPPGTPPACGTSRPAIDRLEPSSNPPGSVVLVVGRGIEQATTREIRVAGSPLAQTDIQWPPLVSRFAGMVAIHLPANIPLGLVEVEILNDGGGSNPAPLEILDSFPPGPEPPSDFVFPSPMDVASVPVVTVDPINDAPASSLHYRYDFDGSAANGEDVQSQCVAAFTGVEEPFLDVFDADGFIRNNFCVLEGPTGELNGLCLAPSDALFENVPYAVDTCCDGNDASTLDCESGRVVACTGDDCVSVDCARFRFVPESPFFGTWNLAENRFELTVARRTGMVDYVGECLAADVDADPEVPGVQRPCRDLLLRDPAGRQVLFPIDAQSDFRCD